MFNNSDRWPILRWALTRVPSAGGLPSAASPRAHLARPRRRALPASPHPHRRAAGPRGRDGSPAAPTSVLAAIPAILPSFALPRQRDGGRAVYELQILSLSKI